MSKLKDFRLTSGLSQECLAKQIKVSQQAIVKWESGQSKPRADKLKKLAKIFNCTIDELLS